MILCWYPQRTGASLWQNYTPAGQLERAVSDLCDTNALVSSLNSGQSDTPLLHHPSWTVCVSGCIQAFLSCCLCGCPRTDRGFGVHVSLYENHVSLWLFAQRVSLYMLLQHECLHVPGVHLHLGECAYCVFVGALLCVRAD